MSDEQQPQAAAGQEVASTDQRSVAPRRIVLRRNQDGGYEILMGHRLIQSFCSEFENITRWAMPANSQQQVRIRIEPVGAQHEASYSDREPLINVDQGQPILRESLEVGEDREVALFSTAHPGNPTVTMTWQDEAREQLVREIEQRQNMIDLLAGMR